MPWWGVSGESELLRGEAERERDLLGDLLALRGGVSSVHFQSNSLKSPLSALLCIAQQQAGTGLVLYVGQGKFWIAYEELRSV